MFEVECGHNLHERYIRDWIETHIGQSGENSWWPIYGHASAGCLFHAICFMHEADAVSFKMWLGK